MERRSDTHLHSTEEQTNNDYEATVQREHKQNLMNEWCKEDANLNDYRCRCKAGLLPKELDCRWEQRHQQTVFIYLTAGTTQWLSQKVRAHFVQFFSPRDSIKYCRQLFSIVADPEKINPVQSQAPDGVCGFLLKPETAHISFRHKKICEKSFT